MSKVQELEVSELEVSPPRKMKAIPIYFVNRSFARLVEMLSEHLFWASVATSNNTRGTCGTRDINEFKDSWEGYKSAKEGVKQSHTGDNPAPDGSLDTKLAVLVPAPYEKVRYLNSCWKQPCLEIFNLIDVYAAQDDSGLASEVKNWGEIEDAEGAVDKAIETFFGANAKAPTPKAKLGRLSPPANFQYEVKIEPGAGHPKTGYPDAPDTEIEVVSRT